MSKDFASIIAKKGEAKKTLENKSSSEEKTTRSFSLELQVFLEFKSKTSINNHKMSDIVNQALIDYNKKH